MPNQVKSLMIKHKLISIILILAIGLVLPLSTWASPVPGTNTNNSSNNSPDNSNTPDPISLPNRNAEEICNASSALSWMLCPLLMMGAGIADISYDFLNSQLQLKPELLSGTDQGTNTAQEIWQRFRDFANIGFVLVFFVIILSHLTGFGLSNYHIKKMLPKIIMSAILINLSYYLVQVAIDLSNLVGSNLRSLFRLPLPPNPSQGASGLGFVAWVSATFLVMAGWLLATVTPMMAFVFPVLIFVLVTIFVTIFILVARQAVAVILTILAPLAFLSIILPNTENFFKTWKKILTGVLVAYPVIAMVFGAADLTGSLLTQVAANSNGGWMMDLIAKLIFVAPLVVAPSLIKNSIAALPVVGSKLTQLTSKLQSKAWQSARKSPLSSVPMERYEARKAARRAGQSISTNPMDHGLSALHRGKNRFLPSSQAAVQADIDKRTSAMANSMTRSDAEILKSKRAGERLSRNDLSKMSAGFRASYQASSGNMAMAHMAAAEQLSAGGYLRDNDYRSLMQNAASHGGFSEEIAMASSRRIFNNARAKGSIDTEAYVNSIINNPSATSITDQLRSGLSQNTAENYLSRLSADRLASVSAGAMQDGSVTAQAVSNLARSDPKFKFAVQGASTSGNMSAETHNQFQHLGAI